MANYYAAARSNYFKVKDLAALKEALAPWELDIIEGVDKHAGRVCILETGGDSNGWNAIQDDDDGEPLLHPGGTFVWDVVAQHLVPESIAIFMEAGAEKLRYISGFSIAVNDQGIIGEVSLNEIYEKAQAACPDAEITEAHY